MITEGELRDRRMAYMAARIGLAVSIIWNGGLWLWLYIQEGKIGSNFGSLLGHLNSSLLPLWPIICVAGIFGGALLLVNKGVRNIAVLTVIVCAGLGSLQSVALALGLIIWHKYNGDSIEPPYAD